MQRFRADDAYEVALVLKAAAAFAPQPPTPQGVRFVARQPILDRQRRLFGYELLFRDSWVNSFGATDPTSRAGAPWIAHC